MGGSASPFVTHPKETLNWFSLSSTFSKLWLKTQPAENQHVATTLGTIESVCEPYGS